MSRPHIQPWLTFFVFLIRANRVQNQTGFGCTQKQKIVERSKHFSYRSQHQGNGPSINHLSTLLAILTLINRFTCYPNEWSCLLLAITIDYTIHKKFNQSMESLYICPSFDNTFFIDYLKHVKHTSLYMRIFLG